MQSHIKLSPNPAKRSCTVSYFSNNSFRSDLMVFDILGKVVLKKNVVISKGTNTFRLETNRLAPGLYFIRLANAGIANVERLVVQ
ncbi:MAG: T9SS type A sorting domain-containing protein [Segetibacter sp.]|nr:T9SS type A sorting domain-containing protein [Segetibacter sp.]